VIDLRCYVVTDTAMCGARGVPAVVADAVAGGATMIQVRDPAATARELTSLVTAVLHVVARRVPVIVNDRVDVALAAGADGAHLGQSDLDPLVARRLGPDLILGLSVTSLAEARAAQAAPVDLLGVGPVFVTATKPDAAAPLGFTGLAEICAASSIPCVAIGGLSASDAPTVRAAGAAGICVVSAVCAAPDPRAATAEILAAW
jgi:thiamine-phosphate pyrophosphorylase